MAPASKMARTSNRRSFPAEVDVAALKERRSHPRVRSHAPQRRQLFLSMLIGLGCALAFHFLHGAGEIYQLSFSDPHFWFHLVLEGTIALYGWLISLIIWRLVKGVKTVKNSKTNN